MRSAIGMEDLRSADMRERLKRVWSDPFSLDPAKHVARGVATARGGRWQAQTVSNVLARSA
jgi:hypothetical protein